MILLKTYPHSSDGLFQCEVCGKKLVLPLRDGKRRTRCRCEKDKIKDFKVMNEGMKLVREGLMKLVMANCLGELSAASTVRMLEHCVEYPEARDRLEEYVKGFTKKGNAA